MLINLALALTLVLPDTGVTVYEKPSDRLVVTSYHQYKKTAKAYLRGNGSNSFQRKPRHWRVAVSPDGRRAMAASAFVDGKGCSSFDLINRRTGATRHIPVSGLCGKLAGGYFSWSPDSRKVVQLAFVRKGETKAEVKGYLTIDAGSGGTRYVAMPKSYKDARFIWTPDAKQIVAYDKKSIRFLSPDGKLRRTLTGKGPLAGEENTFSPSGDRFLTGCPDGGICIWSVKTGEEVGRVPTSYHGVFGWWDSSHLIIGRTSGKKHEFVQVDMDGKVIRVLASGPLSSYTKNRVELHYTRR
ncbi:WD40 repeat domain-containing protein [Herbidospora cretacea]|uniref:WD40 repeat domain-containing protein n=1 Tax=Herbidospora cretacea TaxID=28444 RepID=UPI000773DCF3|nr:WD40 repeat domain-containing protein [Herbidospora cretacea]